MTVWPYFPENERISAALNEESDGACVALPPRFAVYLLSRMTARRLPDASQRNAHQPADPKA
jgi:hypothetical protein